MSTYKVRPYSEYSPEKQAKLREHFGDDVAKKVIVMELDDTNNVVAATAEDPSSEVGTIAREAISGVPGVVTGALGGGAGVALKKLTTAALAKAAPIVFGLGGSAGEQVLQDKVIEKLGGPLGKAWLKRQAIDRQLSPRLSTAGQVLSGLSTGKIPVSAKELKNLAGKDWKSILGIQAAIGGGTELGAEYMAEGKVDPVRVATAAVGNAAMLPNKRGEQLSAKGEQVWNSLFKKEGKNAFNEFRAWLSANPGVDLETAARMAETKGLSIDKGAVAQMLKTADVSMNPDVADAFIAAAKEGVEVELPVGMDRNIAKQLSELVGQVPDDDIKGILTEKYPAAQKSRLAALSAKAYPGTVAEAIDAKKVGEELDRKIKLESAVSQSDAETARGENPDPGRSKVTREATEDLAVLEKRLADASKLMKAAEAAGDPDAAARLKAEIEEIVLRKGIAASEAAKILQPGVVAADVPPKIPDVVGDKPPAVVESKSPVAPDVPPKVVDAPVVPKVGAAKPSAVLTYPSDADLAVVLPGHDQAAVEVFKRIPFPTQAALDRAYRNYVKDHSKAIRDAQRRDAQIEHLQNVADLQNQIAAGKAAAAKQLPATTATPKTGRPDAKTQEEGQALLNTGVGTQKPPSILPAKAGKVVLPSPPAIAPEVKELNRVISLMAQLNVAPDPKFAKGLLGLPHADRVAAIEAYKKSAVPAARPPANVVTGESAITPAAAGQPPVEVLAAAGKPPVTTAKPVEAPPAAPPAVVAGETPNLKAATTAQRVEGKPVTPAKTEDQLIQELVDESFGKKAKSKTESNKPPGLRTISNEDLLKGAIKENERLDAVRKELEGRLGTAIGEVDRANLSAELADVNRSIDKGAAEIDRINKIINKQEPTPKSPAAEKDKPAGLKTTPMEEELRKLEKEALELQHEVEIQNEALQSPTWAVLEELHLGDLMRAKIGLISKNAEIALLRTKIAKQKQGGYTINPAEMVLDIAERIYGPTKKAAIEAIKLTGRGADKLTGYLFDTWARGEGQRFRDKLGNVGARVFEEIPEIRRVMNMLVNEAESVLDAVDFDKASEHDLAAVLDNQWAMSRGEKPLFVLTPRQAELNNAVEAVKDVTFVQKFTDGPLVNGTRAPEKRPGWAIDSAISKKAREIMGGPDSPEKLKMTQEFIKRFTDAGKTEAEARKIMDAVLGRTASDSTGDITQFGELDRAEGIGVPESWRETDLKKLMHWFTFRHASGLAWYRVVQKQPWMAKFFGERTNGRGVEIPEVVTLPNGETFTDSMLNNPNVAAVRDYFARIRGGDSDILEKLSSIATSHRIGPFSAIRDVVGSIGPMGEVMSREQAGAAIEAFQHLLTGDTSAFKTGTMRTRRSLDFNTMQSTEDVFVKLAELARTVQGRNFTEKATRVFLDEMGKIVARNALANSQNPKARAWLEKVVGKSWTELTPDNVTERAGQRFSEHVQGSYGPEYQPGWMHPTSQSWLKSTMSLGRWSVERYNRWKDATIEPMKQGDIKPFLKSTLLSLGVAAPAIGVIEEIIRGSKPAEKTWTEVINSKGEDFWNTLFAKSAMVGYGGVTMNAVRSLHQLWTGQTPMMFEYPMASMLADITMNAAMAAYSGGREDGPAGAIEGLMKGIFEGYANQWQIYKRLTRQQDEKREQRMFERAEGKNEFSFSRYVRNPYDAATQFREAPDVTSARKILPRLEKIYRRDAPLERTPTVQSTARKPEFYSKLAEMQGRKAAMRQEIADAAREDLIEQKREMLRQISAPYVRPD